MSLHTTWRVGGPADLLVRAPTPDDLRAAVAWGVAEGLPITVIGGGSNLLVGDRGIRGLVILARTPGERAEQSGRGRRPGRRGAAAGRRPGAALLGRALRRPSGAGRGSTGGSDCRGRSAARRSTTPAPTGPSRKTTSKAVLLLDNDPGGAKRNRRPGWRRPIDTRVLKAAPAASSVHGPGGRSCVCRRATRPSWSASPTSTPTSASGPSRPAPAPARPSPTRRAILPGGCWRRPA